MKKSIAFIVFLLLFVSLVHAEDAVANETATSIVNVSEGIKNVTSGIYEQSNNALEQKVALPENFAFIGSLFGVKGDVDLRQVIVLLCLWLLMFLILRQVLEIVPFFGEGWQSWAGGASITTIAALSGGLNEMANFFFSLGGFFGTIRNQSLFQLALSLIVLLAFYTIMSKIMHKVVKESRKAKAEALGETLNRGAKSANVFNNAVEDLARKK